MSAMLKYSGSCHCGAIRYEVLAPRELRVVDCNCSVCTKKQNRHFVVPASNFKLVTGHTELTTYTFGTHQAKHMFCSKCGVQSFYIPRSNPDGMAIMPHCLNSPLPLKMVVEKFDGKNCEDQKSKNGFRDRSKH
ncbi:Centromere protein V [Orchesella cincta]|uniref:Centromere protein V n=1 Tax=Orchesella cincta TaxID=48709 RepID=A0A1D2MIY9_ORCCI|nr:Centromere protein V [Orchesella cincta]